MMNEKMKAAVQYARKGLSVLPMAGKQPMIKFADSEPMTEEEVVNFWLTHPDANIAVRTTNFFVVDVDVHNGAQGIQSFKSIGHDEWFKDTLVARTASGGYHYFFLKPDGVNIRQSINFMDGIDIKAHVNNYVMIAPSEIDGKFYEFMNNKPIATPCKELIDFITKKQKLVETFKTELSYRNNSGSSKTTELFEMLVNGLGGEGGRNDTLTSLCGGLLFRNVKAESILKLALFANSNTADPLSEKEVFRTVESMIKKEIRKRGAE